MKLREEEKQEAEVILQLHMKMDYSNKKQVEKIYTMFQTKQILSELGKLYVGKLRNLVEDGLIDSHCSICKEPLRDNEFCICRHCSEKMLKQCKEKQTRQEEKQRRKLSNRAKKMMTIAIALLVMVGVICFGIWFFGRKDDKSFSFSRKDFIEAYAQNLSHYDLSLGEEMAPDQNCYQYAILPTNDSLLLFEGDRGRIQGIELFLRGTDEESRLRQILLMSLLNVTLYEDMTIEESGNLISELAKNQGIMTYQDEEWHLKIDGEKVYFLVMKQQDAQGTDEGRSMLE